MRNKILIILLFSKLFGSNAFSQNTQQYDISIAGISIGEMTAEKKAVGEEIHYEIKSNVSFWFFGKINLDYLTQSVYKNKQLMRADVRSSTNKGDFQSTIRWNSSKYDIQASNYKFDQETTYDKPLYYSSVSFFFEEPLQVKEFIAESYGIISPIKKIKDYYEVEVNGNTNRYYFVDGKLDKAVMEFPVKNYVIKKK
ncbi:hypothetical protein IPZ59_15725 [Mongoliitalea daihaiensis]|nr:hypothetical protein IPZ59_15725 [Mongoliitalea daihaiensis]